VDNLLKWNAMLMVPTAPSAPPAAGASQEALAPLRQRVIGVNAIAGLCGLPQVIGVALLERESTGAVWSWWHI